MKSECKPTNIMGLIVSWLMMLSFVVLSVAPRANADNNNALRLNDVSEEVLNIVADEEELDVTYGEYVEVQFSLDEPQTKAINWSVEYSTVPEGLYLEETNGDDILLSGFAQFTGQWCFVLAARTDETNAKGGAAEFCLNAADNDRLEYPRFVTQRVLEQAELGDRYKERIEVESDVPYEGEVYYSNLPEDMEIDIKDSSSRFEVEGRPQQEGRFEFVLRATDVNGEFNSRQYILDVRKEIDRYNCPPGYYYDDNVGYCVQEQLNTCPDGTYYEPDTNSCVQYPQPPPTIRCRAGFYYDHYLGQCVRRAYPRCPLGYRYDAFYNRCMPRPYFCPIGYRYSWLFKTCVRRYYHRTCGIGEHYDYYLRRCVSNYRHCRVGEYWDRRTLRCESTRRSCRRGEYYSPRHNRCVRHDDRRSCSPGYRWNGHRCELERRRCGHDSRWSHADRRCVPITRPPKRRYCGPNEHWSPRTGRCMPSHRPPRTRPAPPHRPPRTKPTPPPRTRPNPPRTKPTPPPRTRPNPPRTKPTPPPRTRPNPPRTKPTPPPRTRPNPPRTKPTPPPRTRPTPPPRTRPTPPRTRPNPPRTKPSPPRRGNPGKPPRCKPRNPNC